MCMCDACVNTCGYVYPGDKFLPSKSKKLGTIDLTVTATGPATIGTKCGQREGIRIVPCTLLDIT